MKFSRNLAFWAAAIFLIPGLFAQDPGAPAVWELKPPGQPASDAWVEGEAFAEQTGGTVTVDGECYGGKYWGVYRKPAAPAKATWLLSVPKAGHYQLMMAGQPVGVGYTSPIRLSVDAGAAAVVGKRPMSQVSWASAKAVRWVDLGTFELTAGAHRFTIEVDGKRPMDDNQAFRVDALALSKASAGQKGNGLGWTTGRPGNVFTTSSPTKMLPPEGYTEGSVTCVVSNFSGKEIFRGEASLQAPLVLGELPEGYFEATFLSKGAELQVLAFARVVEPASRTLSKESPFAVDTALSWLSKPSKNVLFPSNSMEMTRELVKLCGLTAVRDRMSWNQVNPKEGEYFWSNIYSSNLEALSAQGVQVLSVYHDAPAYSKGRLVSVPEDLFALYRFNKEMAARWGSKVMGWEFWNEPDISFCKDPAWDFAAAQKVAYLGYKAGDPNARVLIASAAQNLPLPTFYEALFENGVGSHFDVFNFHIYRELREYPAILADIKEVLGRYGLGHKELWVTENGLGHEGGGKRKPLMAGQNLAEHDSDQDRHQAEHLVKALVTATAGGVSRDFFFVFPPYNERDNQKVWGIFRWDFSVKPAAPALATLTHVLGAATYLGKLDLAPGMEAYLYSQGNEGRLVYWTSNSEPVVFTVPNPEGKVEQVDLVGTRESFPRGASVSLKAGRLPKYLTGLRGLAPTQKPSPRVADKSAPNEPLVVLRFTPVRGFSNASKIAGRLTSEMAEAQIEVFNFSEGQKIVNLVDSSRGCAVGGLLKTITVGPMGVVKVPITMKATEEKSSLRVSGLCGGKEVSPIMVPFSVDFTTRRDVSVRDLHIIDASRWRKNSAGDLKISFDEAEKAVRFDVSFPPRVDRWVYPEFPLDLPKESLERAAGISFEVRSAKTSAKEFHNLVMAVMENLQEKGMAHYFPYGPQKEGWQEVRVDFADGPKTFDPKGIQMLRIGCNPPLEAWTFWVRNLKVYYRK